MAKRYNVVIQSEDLEDIVREDWSGFKDGEATNNLYETVRDYVDTMFQKVAKANVDETRTIVKSELKSKLAGASPLALYEVDEVIENIIVGNPTATKESISLAVEAVVNLESSKNGRELLVNIVKTE